MHDLLILDATLVKGTFESLLDPSGCFFRLSF